VDSETAFITKYKENMEKNNIFLNSLTTTHRNLLATIMWE